jgi:general secretion pathway protein L
VFESIAAIDIGSSSIKMVLAKRGLRDFHITDLLTEPVDLSSDDRETAQRQAIERLIAKNPIKGSTPLVNLPMEKTIIRHLVFPFNDKSKIAEAVTFEAQENIPFDVHDLDLDYQITSGPLDDSGRVIVAATHAETISDYTAFLENSDLRPVHIGLESNALYECYTYFAYNEDENVIQLDIGHSKTIINIIRDNRLMYTRCITIGTGIIISKIASQLKISEDDARTAFEGLRLDLSDFDATLTRGGYKNYGVTKQKLKTIHAFAMEIIHDIIEQTNLTLKSFAREFGALEFRRLLFTGGGSHLHGITSILSKETGIHSEKADFPIAIGMALSFFTRSERINFLKGDFRPSYVPATRQHYRLAAAFITAALLILLVHLFINLLFQTFDARRYHAVLESQFSRYFQNRPTQGDPLAEAEKIVSTEKQELKLITDIIPSGPTMLQALQDVTSQFPGDQAFQVKNLVIDNEFIRIDGETSSGSTVDTYKNKLIETKKFESVTLNTTMSRRDLVSFTLAIKLKRQTTPAKGN